jgi:hypothetical protein
VPNNIREIILACLGWYLNHYYDGEPITGWTWDMIAVIAKGDGVKHSEDYLKHIQHVLDSREIKKGRGDNLTAEAKEE